MKLSYALFLATATWVCAGTVLEVSPAGTTTRTTTAAEESQLQFDAIAAQVAASNDAIRAAAPVEFPNGIAIPDSSSTNPVYEIGVEDGALVTWVSHASPYDPAAAESNRVAALAERQQIKADLKNLIGVAQTNKAQVQATTNLPNFTNAQITNGTAYSAIRDMVNTLRRELIDANDAVIESVRLSRAVLNEKK
jgi:hypothetical protein